MRIGNVHRFIGRPLKTTFFVIAKNFIRDSSFRNNFITRNVSFLIDSLLCSPKRKKKTIFKQKK